METTFRRLLIDILEDRNINLADLFNELNDLGLNITYSSLYSYYTGTVIPPFRTAKKLLKKENVILDDDELEAILDKSRKIAKSERDDASNLLVLNLKIKPDLIDEGFKNNSSALRNIIALRAEELFVDDELMTKFAALGKRKLSAYVAYLIKKDLIESEFISDKEGN